VGPTDIPEPAELIGRLRSWVSNRQ